MILARRLMTEKVLAGVGVRASGSDLYAGDTSKYVSSIQPFKEESMSKRRLTASLVLALAVAAVPSFAAAPAPASNANQATQAALLDAIFAPATGVPSPVPQLRSPFYGYCRPDLLGLLLRRQTGVPSRPRKRAGLRPACKLPCAEDLLHPSEHPP